MYQEEAIESLLVKKRNTEQNATLWTNEQCAWRKGQKVK